ncbi:MAG: efflux RND transporter periplasmic adaptor subunit [Actinomycetota bacterium]
MSSYKSPESVADLESQPSTSLEEGQSNAESAEFDQTEDLTTISDRPRLPQQQRPKWLLAVGAVLLTIGAAIGWQRWHSNHSQPPQQAPGAAQSQGIPVKLAPVVTTTLQDSSEFVGSLEAKRSVEIRPETEARVTQILVQPGDFVQKGQAIARMKSDSAEADLRQSQANLVRAQARLAELQAGSRPEEIAQAQAQVAQAQANLTQLRTGNRPEEIGQGQARVAEAEANLADAQTGSLLEDIAQAKAQIEANKAEAELAGQQLARYEQLAKEGAESENTYQQYLQKERTARANLRESERRLNQRQQNRQAEIERRSAALQQQRQALRQLQNGARPEEIAKAQAQLAEAQSKLVQLQNGTRKEEIAQAEAEVAQAAAQVRGLEVQLQETVVTAPFAGVIGDVPVKVGDYLKKGDAITSLTENQVLDLSLSVPLERKSQLRLGLPVQLLDAQGKPTAQGEISFISPNVNATSQTVLAKATFPNPSGQLLNRQFLKARVTWNERPGILVPVTAITRLGGQTFVFIAQKPEQTKPGMPPLVAQQKPVKLGAIQGNNYQVLEGLKAGERVVVAGILNLTDGAPIAPQSEATGNR